MTQDNRVMRMKWLVFGSEEMFGSDMLYYLKEMNEDATGLNSKDLELTQELEIIAEKINAFDVVINAAAFTNVNMAETKKAKALELNEKVLAKLAQISSAGNQKLLHVSTDYVFDGKQECPYLKSDKPNPINVYGQSKLAGEKQIQEHNDKAQLV